MEWVRVDTLHTALTGRRETSVAHRNAGLAGLESTRHTLQLYPNCVVSHTNLIQKKSTQHASTRHRDHHTHTLLSLSLSFSPMSSSSSRPPRSLAESIQRWSLMGPSSDWSKRLMTVRITPPTSVKKMIQKEALEHEKTRETFLEDIQFQKQQAEERVRRMREAMENGEEDGEEEESDSEEEEDPNADEKHNDEDEDEESEEEEDEDEYENEVRTHKQQTDSHPTHLATAPT